MESNQAYLYDIACYQMRKEDGIRFAGLVNKNGRKVAGGFSPKVIPFEKDEKKIEMLMMELSLDLSMRKEFNNSLGDIRAIISYREKTNIFSIPHGDNFMLLSTEPETNTEKVIQLAHQYLRPIKNLEVMVN